MTKDSSNLKGAAKFDVKPERSQVVLVSFIVTTILSLCIGGGLLLLDKMIGILFVLIAILLIGIVSWGWNQSNRNIDLAESHQTNIVTGNGAQLSTDSRLLISKEGIKSLVQIIEALAIREELPEPDGITGKGAIFIPNSKQEATEVVAKINSNNRKLHDQIVSELHKQMNGTVGFEEPNFSADLPPHLSQNSENKVLET